MIAQRPSKIAEIFIFTLAIWIFEFMSVYLTFLALHYDVPMAAVLMGTMLMNVSFMIPSLPGYAGTYEALWLIVYGALGLTDLTLLAALALLNHLLSILWVSGLGALGTVWLGLSFREILRFRELQEAGGAKTERLL